MPFTRGALRDPGLCDPALSGHRPCRSPVVRCAPPGVALTSIGRSKKNQKKCPVWPGRCYNARRRCVRASGKDVRAGDKDDGRKEIHVHSVLFHGTSRVIHEPSMQFCASWNATLWCSQLRFLGVHTARRANFGRKKARCAGKVSCLAGALLQRLATMRSRAGGKDEKRQDSPNSGHSVTCARRSSEKTPRNASSGFVGGEPEHGVSEDEI